ncbi:MAG: adenylyl-sulfate kinase [Thermodesulfovibrionales bacterium]|jgi:adenylylsulfate kinase
MQPVIWITGLPGSGKSTIAEGVKGLIPLMVILRMDEMRKIVTPEPTYSETERELVYRSLVYTAKLLSELGHPVIIDATGNMKRWRDLARKLIPGFAEVYLKCPVVLCSERESARKETHGAPSAIYHKGREGWPVPGMNAPYEEPLCPELTIETDRLSPAETIREVINLIRIKEKEQYKGEEHG